MRTTIHQHLTQGLACLQRLMANETSLINIEKSAKIMIQSLKNGHKIMSCGNGGSLCDAMHFAEELSGRFRENRPALAALAISDPGHMSCTANDFGYDFVFQRFLEAHARQGDVLLGISTSGKSNNIIKAAQWAKQHGVTVVSLTGKENSPLGLLSDIDIVCTGEKYADLVQELHIKVIHILIELIEQGMFTKVTTDATPII